MLLQDTRACLWTPLAFSWPLWLCGDAVSFSHNVPKPDFQVCRAAVRLAFGAQHRALLGSFLCPQHVRIQWLSRFCPNRPFGIDPADLYVVPAGLLRWAATSLGEGCLLCARRLAVGGTPARAEKPNDHGVGCVPTAFQCTRVSPAQPVHCKIPLCKISRKRLRKPFLPGAAHSLFECWLRYFVTSDLTLYSGLAL